MKKFYFSVAMASMLALGFTACSDDNNKGINEPNTQVPGQPQEEGVLTLEGSGANKLYQLLTKADPVKQCMSRQSVHITEEQFAEIAAFTAKLTDGSASATNKYRRIFNWVSEHIKYDHQGGHSQDPYDVFVNKLAICQGFSNLMKVMLLSQEIPAILVNGFLESTGGAHAWVYCYADGKWIVSDPTNKYDSPDAKKVADYEHVLNPVMAEIQFEQDGFVCDFNGANFNLASIKKEEASVTIPDQVCGITVSGFIPQKDLPASITEINLGNHVVSLGSKEMGNILLTEHGKNLKSVLVGPANMALEVYGGAVYQKLDDSNLPYFVPPMVEELRLKPLQKLEKGTVFGFSRLKHLFIADGVKEIEPYAVEQCDALEVIQLPASFDMSTLPKDAFAVPETCKIVTGQLVKR